MRVISGAARGRKLTLPKAANFINPTSDRVKEAIFDIIQFDIEGRRTLDLFTGSGQLGIEALSRGARSVSFVDERQEALDIARANVELCKSAFPDAVYNFYRSDAILFLKRNEKYDLVLLDPPYMTNLTPRALETIITVDKVTIGGIIVCESFQAHGQMAGYSLKSYKYGRTNVTVYTKKDEAS